jgi:hypothetical protein
MTISPLRDQWLTEDGPDEVTGHERSSTERVSFWKVFDGVIGQVAGGDSGRGGQEGVSHGLTALAGAPVGLRAVCLLGSTIRSRRSWTVEIRSGVLKLSTIGGYLGTGIASGEPLKGGPNERNWGGFG